MCHESPYSKKTYNAFNVLNARNAFNAFNAFNASNAFNAQIASSDQTEVSLELVEASQS